MLPRQLLKVHNTRIRLDSLDGRGMPLKVKLAQRLHAPSDLVKTAERRCERQREHTRQRITCLHPNRIVRSARPQAAEALRDSENGKLIIQRKRLPQRGGALRLCEADSLSTTPPSRRHIHMHNHKTQSLTFRGAGLGELVMDVSAEELLLLCTIRHMEKSKLTVSNTKHV